MAGRVGTLTQCLVGDGEIVLARRIQFVRSDGLRQRLGGQPVIAGCLIQQAHDVQRGRLPRVERKDLLAENFRVDRAAFLKGKRGSGRKLCQVRRRFSLAARQCGPAISSAHAASPRAGRLFFESSSHPSLLFEHSFSETRLPRFRIHAPMPKSHINRHCREERRESRMSMARGVSMREADMRRPRRNAHQKSSVGQIVFSCGISDASLPTCRTTGESPSLWRSAKIWPMKSE
jgi:hypothetical protein